MTTRSGRVVSAAANRPEDGEHDGDRDDPGEETVPEFDERMVFERGDELVLFAGRPVRTAEAGTGESDGRPGDHDDGQRPECASDELDVALREIAPRNMPKTLGPAGWSCLSGRSLRTCPQPPTRGAPEDLAFVALMKLRIVELLLVTTVPTMIVAEGGLPSLWLIFATVFGGTLAAGGAHAFNMYIDRDIDALMERTKDRPLVTGEVTPRQALVFAFGVEIVAFGWLWATVNVLSAALAVSATLFYVFVYSLWLKRNSTANIVIGGAAGAVPVLVGWSAVTNTLDWPPVVLFAIIFYWTPPHFWALAIRYRDDYQAAEVPMLPAVTTLRRTATRIILYTVVLWALTLLFAPVADMGAIYTVSAVVIGAVFLGLAVKVYRDPQPKPAMALFGWSITYVTLLFGAMAVDVMVRNGL